MSWLQAVADRAACGLIAVEGSTLFTEDNAKLVRKQFSDVIAGMTSVGEEEKAPFEPESPHEAA